MLNLDSTFAFQEQGVVDGMFWESVMVNSVTYSF
jgi:hypothetical protein